MTDNGTRNDGSTGRSFFYGWWFPANLVTFARIVLVVALVLCLYSGAKYVAGVVGAPKGGEAR